MGLAYVCGGFSVGANVFAVGGYSISGQTQICIVWPGLYCDYCISTTFTGVVAAGWAISAGIGPAITIGLTGNPQSGYSFSHGIGMGAGEGFAGWEITVDIDVTNKEITIVIPRIAVALGDYYYFGYRGSGTCRGCGGPDVPFKERHGKAFGNWVKCHRNVIKAFENAVGKVFSTNYPTPPSTDVIIKEPITGDWYGPEET